MVETRNECQDEAYMPSHGKLATLVWCMSGFSPSIIFRLFTRCLQDMRHPN